MALGVMESITNRTLNGVVVRQRISDSFFALKDLCLVCDRLFYEQGRPRFDINQYFRLDSTKRFIAELEARKGVKVFYKQTKARLGWVHPHLFLDILLWADSEFKVEVYDWLWDCLIKNRVDSANSYIIMSGTLYEFANNKNNFKADIAKLANIIKNMIGVEDWNKASENDLKRRDELQKSISDFTATLRNAKLGVKFGIENFKRKNCGVKDIKF